MIRRNILDYFRQWAKRRNRKPLVVRGARQVGKTTAIKEFAREFDAFVMLNMELEADKKIFDSVDTAQKVLDILLLTRLNGLARGENKKILLFIDEIQSQPKAIAMLRYFYEDLPDLYVIAAGSRLQELFKTGVSFPVGRVEYVSMRPCFFDEFLDGLGLYNLRNYLDNADYQEHLHDEFMSLFKTYALIGGMPEIVSEYAYSKSVTDLSPLYKGLLQSYDEDVEKYAVSRQQVAVLRHLLRNGWNHAGQSISFARFGGSNYTSSMVHDAFILLERAYLLNLDYPVTSVTAPAETAYSRSPKLVWVDTGLVNFSASIQEEYLTNTSLTDVWRGNAAEQIVGQELWQVLDRCYEDKQMYWLRDKNGSNAEVDFILPLDGKIIPIEVKSGANAHLRSLQSFMSQPGATDVAVRVWPGKLSMDTIQNPLSGREFRLLNVPFYLASKLDILIRKMLLNS